MLIRRLPYQFFHAVTVGGTMTLYKLHELALYLAQRRYHKLLKEFEDTAGLPKLDREKGYRDLLKKIYNLKLTESSLDLEGMYTSYYHFKQIGSHKRASKIKTKLDEVDDLLQDIENLEFETQGQLKKTMDER